MRSELRPGQKLAAFAVALLVAFAAGWGIGAAVEPVVEPDPPAHDGGHQP